MQIIRLTEVSKERLQQILRRSSADVFAADRMAHVRSIIEDVQRHGDEAIVEYTQRYDGVTLTPDQIRVDRAEVRQAYGAVDDGLRAALATSIDRARRYNARLRPPELTLEEVEPGITTGVKVTPVESVGVYVPSGKGSFPSTLITLVTPAVVAGVEEIAIVLPPRQDRSVDPAALVAADLLGVAQVFRANGVAGIAGLTFGTAALPRVRLLGGPGNPYVTAAQIAVQAYGVRLLSILGPTESMILADLSADPDRLALDLLNEAEHGKDSAAILITSSETLVSDVSERLPRYLVSSRLGGASSRRRLSASTGAPSSPDRWRRRSPSSISTRPSTCSSRPGTPSPRCSRSAMREKSCSGSTRRSPPATTRSASRRPCRPVGSHMSRLA